MRGFITLFAVTAVLAWAASTLTAGETTAQLSDSGIIVPIGEERAHVLDHRVTITLPRCMRTWQDPEVVRTEYVLVSDAGQPVAIPVGWPIRGIRYRDYQREKLVPSCIPFIKLDGKPVGYNLLSFDDLAEPYVREWMERIDHLLESRPALQEQVLKVREEGAERGRTWLEGLGSHDLESWMRKNNVISGPGAEAIAGGLLGVKPDSYGGRRDYFVQRALMWLAPDDERVNVYRILSERWGHEVRLLNPSTGQLVDVRSDMLEWEPEFAVFRCSLTLEPGRKHRLVVQYGQFLGGADLFGNSWHGLVYLMEPARRWGRWERTVIQVRVSREWREVGIRPPNEKIAQADGFDIYRTHMRGRPCENLYVSVR